MQIPKENYINVWREESADILLAELNDDVTDDKLIKMLKDKKRELSHELEIVESLIEQSSRLFT